LNRARKCPKKDKTCYLVECEVIIMRKVELTMDEQMKYEIIKKLVDANAAEK